MTITFRNTLAQVVSSWQIPTLSYALIQNGEIVEVDYIDTTGRGTGCQLFQLGSLSKAFACTALNALADRSDYSLDTPNIHYLPQFRLSEPLLTAESTVVDLVAHRTGIGKFSASLMSYLGYSKFAILRAFELFPAARPFRTSFQYNDGLYLYVDSLIEAITGQTYWAFLEQNVLTPAGLKRVRSCLTDCHVDEVLATPHMLHADSLQAIRRSPMVTSLGAGCDLCADAEDLARWVLFNLNLINDQSRSSHWREALFAAQTPLSPGPVGCCLDPYMQPASYAMGWYIVPTPAGLAYEHLGGVPGYSSYISLLPAKGAGIVLLANRGELRFALEWLRLHYYDLSLGFGCGDLTATLRQQTNAFATSLQLSTASKQRQRVPFNLRSTKLIGRNPVYGELLFAMDCEGATATFGFAIQSLRAVYVGNNEFMASDAGANFGSFLKMILFKLSVDESRLTLTIYHDTQRGGLSLVGTYLFELHSRIN